MIILHVAILVAGGYYCNQMSDKAHFQSLRIDIKNDSITLITEEDVRGMLSSSLFSNMFYSLKQIDTDSIERYLRVNNYIDSVAVYKTEQGELVVDIRQKKPVLRVFTPDGLSYLYDSNGFKIPVNTIYPCRLPVLTCDSAAMLRAFETKEYDKKLPKNYNFLDNLLNFVELVGKDSFWSNQIVQINLNKEAEIELIPRVGCHVIVLCDAKDLSSAWDNLLKMKLFYGKAMNDNMWSTLRKVNLKYRDQVVCIR